MNKLMLIILSNALFIGNVCSMSNLSEKDIQKALFEAIYEGDTEKITRLLGQGAQVGTVDADGSTALNWSARTGHLEVIRLLLKEGAQIEARNRHGATSLHAATRSRKIEAVRLLLESGAEIDAKDGEDKTALQIAAREGHVEIVRLLLEKGAQVNARKENDCTALHLAAFEGHIEVVPVLIEYGAQIDAVTYGETALDYACDEGHDAVLRLLLEKGARIKGRSLMKSWVEELLRTSARRYIPNHRTIQSDVQLIQNVLLNLDDVEVPVYSSIDIIKENPKLFEASMHIFFYALACNEKSLKALLGKTLTDPIKKKKVLERMNSLLSSLKDSDCIWWLTEKFEEQLGPKNKLDDAHCYTTFAQQIPLRYNGSIKKAYAALRNEA